MSPFNLIVSAILVVCGGLLVLKGNPAGYVLWLAVAIKTTVSARNSQ